MRVYGVGCASGLNVHFESHASCWELNSQGKLSEQAVFPKHNSLHSFSFKEIREHKQRNCRRWALILWVLPTPSLRPAPDAQGRGDASESDHSHGTCCGKEPPCPRAGLGPSCWLTGEHTQSVWLAARVLFKQNMFTQSSNYFHHYTTVAC